MARSPRLEGLLAELVPGVSEPQPTTVSHDGGRADQSGARVPRGTPTRLGHVVRLLSERGINRRREEHVGVTSE